MKFRRFKLHQQQMRMEIRLQSGTYNFPPTFAPMWVDSLRVRAAL